MRSRPNTTAQGHEPSLDEEEITMRKLGHRSFFGLFIVAFLMSTAGAQATLIHESATLGAPGQGSGVSLSSNQFLGSRFTVSTTVQVAAIGGHLSAFGTLFGAIISLSSPTALPSGVPFDTTTIASTVFTGLSPSVDFRTPLSVTLPPGDYALIFGSGQFGASGFGVMPSNDTDIPGQASYFFWNVSNWAQGGFANARFVIEDTFCGNGVVESGEQCDDGNTVTEVCDYGLTSCTVCAADCTEQAGATSFCGDGILQPDLGEVCEDGNSNDGDGCSANCQFEPPPPLDHFKCWQAKDLKNPKFVKIPSLPLDDQFAIEDVEVKKPFLICAPADKDGSGINDPNTHLCCYKIKATKLEPPENVEIDDQFGTLQLQVKKAKFLCQPCSKTVLP